jgi:hypothetical protein
LASNPSRERAFKTRRAIAHWSRVLHTYLSMASFSILLFFAVTGITLNHQAWFDGEPHVARLTGTIDPAQLNPQAGAEVVQAPIVEHFRAAHGIKAHLSDFRVDDAEIGVSFKGPGYAADAFIDRKTGAYDMTESRMGFFAIVNDLHKGRDSGAAWSQIIDISAILMVLVSLTGLVLIFFLHKRLTLGLAMLGIGTVVCVAVYIFLVS